MSGILFFIFASCEPLTVCPRKKWAPTDVVPSYKFCFEEGSYIQIILLPQFLPTTAKSVCSFDEVVL